MRESPKQFWNVRSARTGYRRGCIIERTEKTMSGKTFTFTIALALASTLHLAAQQPAAPAAGRRGGGPPGGGAETGLNTRPPNAPDQKPAVPGQTRAPEQKLTVSFEVVTV